ncbi:MAG TPA: MG2 domain-containing protein, partial [Pyrinomonadaceae bacterium]|nr:MG2 domain-containing protein [Pyrinomonadaceae bacterium]
MKTIILSVAVFVFLLFNAVTQQIAQQADYSQQRAAAEKEYSQKSYQRANELYTQVDKSKLSATELRWVEFRLADTSWRAQAATQTFDTTKIDEARKQLAELIRAADKDVDRDLVWAEAHESLADSFWTSRNNLNWAAAWPHYEQALDWWAGQRDLERARARYLAIVFRAATPPIADQYYVYTNYGNYIPLTVLEDALKISTNANDRSQLNFLIAMTMRYTGGGDIAARQRTPDYFEEALKAGKQSPWYDDALFYYAEWLNNTGPMVEVQGTWQPQPDYVKAVELFRRLTTEFSAGETRYFEQAQAQIRYITTPAVSVSFMNIFLPDSELQFYLSARNVRRLDFTLYKIDLTRDITYNESTDKDEGTGEAGNWMQRMSTAGKEAVKTWSKNIDVADYKPVNEQARIDGKLPLGAYLLEATTDSGGINARDLLLVSDATVMLKSSGNQALVFFANALTSAPIANANVTLWENYYESSWRWRRVRQTTNADGIAQFPLREISGSRNLYVTASGNERQAFAAGNSYRTRDSEDWRIYAFTDRPAYRPKEMMQWKIIARRSGSGVYSTPANQVVAYQINDPRGTKVVDGKATLNSFGSAWGSLELGEQLPLGQYQIQFWDETRSHNIGSAALFRLEEYKLPEFKVQVRTPEQDGKKKAFRLGEQVEVDIQADYYFGGPVTNASVEVVVYQSPFYHYWFPRRDYPWYYEDIERQQRGYYGYGRGQVIKRETIKTDSTGKARLTFDSPRENYNQDFEFRIEARVVDSSRREIVSSDTVRVTRQRYYVYPRPERNIYRPQDKVGVDIKAMDANEQPVQTEGKVKVTRDYWWEIWVDPRGREVQGDELRRLQRAGSFPPATQQGQWQLKFRGYQHEDILTTTLKTDAEGVAHLNFT